MSASLSTRLTRRLAEGLSSFRDSLLHSTGLTPVARLGRLPQHMRVYVQPVIQAQTPSPALALLESANELRRRLQDWLEKPILSDLLPSLNKNLLDIFRRKSGPNPSVTEIQNRMTGRRTTATAIERGLSEKIDRATNRDPHRDNARLSLTRKLNANRQAQEASRDYAALEAYINTGTTMLRSPTMCGVPVDWKQGRRLDQAVVVAKATSLDKQNVAASITTGYGLLIESRTGGQAPKAWLGLRVMRLTSSDPTRNKLEIERKRGEVAQALGISPERVGLRYDKDYLQGTSVLLEDENFLPAEAINPAWSGSALEEHFGKSFKTFHQERASAKREASPLPPDLAAFIEMTPTSPTSKQEAPPVERGPGADQAVILLRERTLDLVSRESGTPIFGANLRALWPGDYQIFESSEASEPVGLLRVTESEITQLAYHSNAVGFRELVEHNFKLTTPSSMPALGCDGVERYAHYGQIMSKDHLRTVRARDRQHLAHMPQMPTPAKPAELLPTMPPPPSQPEPGPGAPTPKPGHD